jgi:glycosyltransferase involved in cell wall biosynthesis
MPASATEDLARTGSSRRVLVLGRHFPPIGGAGVHRTLGSARYLPEFGWEPTVVTGPAQLIDRWNPRDAALLARVPETTTVHRLEGPEPGPSSGRKARAERLVQRSPAWTRWWVRHATAAGVRAGGGVDLVLASCVPYDTAFAGACVAQRLGVPWVADLEDPWALDEMAVEPTTIHHRRSLARMRRGLQSAAGVIMCAPEAAVRVRAAFPGLAGRPVVSIPIGYDRDDFSAPPAPRGDGAFRIVHTGSLHTDLGLRHRDTRRARRLLGGTSIDVDILTRSHVVLLDAVDRLIAARPELDGRIEVHLAGMLTERDRAFAQRPYVHTPGLLSHEEVVGLLRSADLLFLPMHDLPPGQRAGLIPYKTYDYLGAGRPILAAVPDGDVRDLLAGMAQASLCRPGDAAGMAAAIARRVDAGPAPDAEPPAHLERRRSVARIAEVLDAAAAAPAGVAAARV